MEQSQNLQISAVKIKGQSVSTTVVLFAVGIGFGFLVFFGWGLVDYISHYSTPEPPPVDTSYPKLSADINDRVKIALTAENVLDPASLDSNFNNKLGGGNSPVAGNLSDVSASLVNNAPRLPPFRASAGITPSETVVTPGVSAPVQIQPNTVNSTQVVSALDRLNERNNQIRRGLAVTPITEIYDIDEVTPLGVVGDERRREVLFYSPVTKQTFSAPLGTKFRNGQLEGAAEEGNTVEGVRFRREDTGRMETRTWAKNSQGKTTDSADQPLLAKEPVYNPKQNRPKVSRKQ